MLRQAIENSLHWSLGVAFAEGKSRIRRGNAPGITVVFRRLALCILKAGPFIEKPSIRGKRLHTDGLTESPKQYSP